MRKMIAIVQGRPDPDGRHYGHALAAASAAGYQVDVIDVARLEFPLLRSKAEFDPGAPPAAIRDAQTLIGRAGHPVFFPHVAGRDAGVGVLVVVWRAEPEMLGAR